MTSFFSDGAIKNFVSTFPIVNPYTVFNKPQVSFKKSIKKLLGPSQSSTVKEYVQASKFDQVIFIKQVPHVKVM